MYKVSVGDELNKAWRQAKVKDLVSQATARGRGKRATVDIWNDLCNARMQLWILATGREIDAIAITEVSEYPRRKICRVIACVGEGRERWQHHLAGIEDWAREIGCSGIELIARKGWVRIMSDYEFTHAMLEKDL